MKLGQGNVFTGICDFVHRGGVCLSACWDTTPPPQSRHPPGADTPLPRADTPLPRADTPLGADTPLPRADTPGADTPELTPLNHPPPQPDTPWSRHPLPEQGTDTPPPPPPREADSGIQSTSGRYASYWNAFLFISIPNEQIVVATKP